MKYPVKFILSYLVLALSVQESCKASFLWGLDQGDKATIADIKARAPHPVGPITAEDNYLHLSGFPTFLELTPKGCKKLMKQGSAHINFEARFSESAEPVKIYSIDHNFFTRPKSPGLYQPDYPIFSPELTYYNLGRIKFYDYWLGQTLEPFMHGCTRIEGPNDFGYSIINSECTLPRIDNLKQAAGILTSLGGTFTWSEDAVSIDGTDQFVETPYTPDLRGIVFVIDADQEFDIFACRTRPVTDQDILTMEKSGQLKIKIRP